MVLLLAAIACTPAPVELIQVRGSDSEVNLVQRLAEAFSADHPAVAVVVSGGGTGVGLAGLVDGTVDLANASRPLSPAERLLALRRGVEPVPTLFAADALSVIVPVDRPLPSLTLQELAAMYRGELTHWPDGQVVTAYGRPSSSGTYGFFRDAVLQGDFGLKVREMNGTAQLVEAVARDPGGIGYVAVGVLRGGDHGVRAVPLRAAAGEPAVDPLDEAAVAEGRYPLTRPLLQYTDGAPRGALREFLGFELSNEGSGIVYAMGFYPPLTTWRDQNHHLEER